MKDLQMSGIFCTADDSRTADRMGTGGCYRHLVYEEGSTPKEEWINSHKETKENEYIAETVV